MDMIGSDFPDPYLLFFFFFFFLQSTRMLLSKRESKNSVWDQEITLTFLNQIFEILIPHSVHTMLRLSHASITLTSWPDTYFPLRH